MRPRTHLSSLLAAALLAGGCAARAPEPDVPAPPSERRDTLVLRVDLERAQRCEERSRRRARGSTRIEG